MALAHLKCALRRVRLFVGIVCTLSMLCDCSHSVDQTLSTDYLSHPIAELAPAELTAAKMVLTRELDEPRHFVRLDIGMTWIRGHLKAETALLHDGYITKVHGTLNYTKKARAESNSCVDSQGERSCIFAIARESIVRYESFSRVPTSIIGYRNTNFVVTIRSSSVSPIGKTLLRSGSLSCLLPAGQSARVPWTTSRQLAMASMTLPTPLRSDKDYDITVSDCPSLEDAKEL